MTLSAGAAPADTDRSSARAVRSPARTGPPPTSAIRSLARRQDAVVTTTQCLELGVDRSWVARRVRTGQWQRLYRGVLVTHSGPVPWRTRARAALLYAGEGAALSHDAAAFLHGFTSTPPRVIDVCIPEPRRVTPAGGLRIHRRRRAIAASGALHVVRPAATVLDLLDRARSSDDAVGLICAAVRARTSPEQILAALDGRPNARRRRIIVDLLGSVTEGVESALELRYHRDVERRHGLPRAELQVRDVVDGRWIRADCVYRGLGVRVELDGWLAHPGGRTDDDVWRDNAVVLARAELTLRYRWRHVYATACRTAAQVEGALRSRGWPGRARRCGPACPVGR